MTAFGPDSLKESGPPIPGLIGSGEAMEQVYAVTRRVAKSDASVLLQGETGTGKELIATAIHRLSHRGAGPLIKVNCGALSESLLESELFGHVRGSFTGAINNRIGRFEAAHTGTIFLDEINSTSMHLQVKLLRVLQEKEFERVGDTQTIQVDTRIIAASNCDLVAEIEAGRFREDLYWRLNVVPIELPPMRARPEDIPELVAYFLNLYSEQNDRYVVHIQPEAMEAMESYSWPGNVRELQNYVERAVVLAESDELTTELLPVEVVQGTAPRAARIRGADLETLVGEVVREGLRQAGPNEDNLYNRIVNRVERELIAQVLFEQGGTKKAAAAKLGINRNTLHKKIQHYQLEEANGEGKQ